MYCVCYVFDRYYENSIDLTVVLVFHCVMCCCTSLYGHIAHRIESSFEFNKLECLCLVYNIKWAHFNIINFYTLYTIYEYDDYTYIVCIVYTKQQPSHHPYNTYLIQIVFLFANSQVHLPCDIKRKYCIKGVENL